MMHNIIIRKGKMEDAQDFANLILLSSPNYYSFFYGPNAKRVMKRLFAKPNNFFSFEHSYFIELNGKKAGMALGYDLKQKQREELYTTLLIFKYLNFSLLTRIFYFIKSQKYNITSELKENEYYLSTIAIYPKFRSYGLGKMLLLKVEHEAQKTGNCKILLNLEKNNKKALKFYKKLGYTIEGKTPNFKINKKILGFFKVTKILKDKGK